MLTTTTSSIANINTIAAAAAEALGPSAAVTVMADNDNVSRYVQYLLRCSDPAGRHYLASRYMQYVLRCSDPAGRHYLHGVATISRIASRGKVYDLPEPVLVANGDGMQDPRGPFHFADLVHALRAVGLKTNDVLPGDEE